MIWQSQQGHRLPWLRIVKPCKTNGKKCNIDLLAVNDSEKVEPVQVIHPAHNIIAKDRSHQVDL